MSKKEAIYNAVDALFSWDGLMEILDTLWPEDICPTLAEDLSSRDPGPRIISLLRWVERLRRENESLRKLLKDQQET